MVSPLPPPVRRQPRPAPGRVGVQQARALEKRLARAELTERLLAHLGLSAPAERWEARAVCMGAAQRFFRDKKEPKMDETAEALKLCRQCPVIMDCRAASVVERDSRAKYGVWGGMTESKRRNMIKLAQEAVNRPEVSTS